MKTSMTPTVAGSVPLSKANRPQVEAYMEEMLGIPYPGSSGGTCVDVKYADIPGAARWKAVPNVTRCLPRTQDQGLKFGGAQVGRRGMPACFITLVTPRAWAAGVRCQGARLSWRGSIAWFLRTPQVVEISSSEVGYIALAGIVKEVLYLRPVQPLIAPTVVDVPIQMLKATRGSLN